MWVVGAVGLAELIYCIAKSEDKSMALMDVVAVVGVSVALTAYLIWCGF